MMWFHCMKGRMNAGYHTGVNSWAASMATTSPQITASKNQYQS